MDVSGNSGVENLPTVRNKTGCETYKSTLVVHEMNKSSPSQ